MNTETQTATLTTEANTLRTILSALDLYTSPDKARHVLTLAQAMPIIVEHIEHEPATALSWSATNSHELIQIDHRIEHTLTVPALIDPAAILATIPKKATGDTVLTLNPEAWQLTTNGTTATGKAAGEHQWPNTYGLFQGHGPEIAPYNIDPTYLGRLAKLAKTLKAETIRHISQGHTDQKPNPNKPLLFTINAGHLTARILIMPQRTN
jgi:hypothetical protein